MIPKVECSGHESGLHEFRHRKKNNSIIVRAAKDGVRMSDDGASRLQIVFVTRPSGRVINPTVKRGVIIHGFDGKVKSGRQRHRGDLEGFSRTFFTGHILKLDSISHFKHYVLT